MKKKITMMVLFMGMVAGAYAEDTNLLAQIKASATPQEALSYLDQTSDGAGVFACYITAFARTPFDAKSAFVATIPPGALSAQQMAILNSLCFRKGAERNNALKTLADGSLNAGHIKLLNRFSASDATKEDCIEFYETVLKNMELNEKTKDYLSQIKGELLKLKDL